MALAGAPPPLTGVKAPSFRRGGSSMIDINDKEFEWLKGYLLRDRSTQNNVVGPPDDTAAGSLLLPELPEEPVSEPPAASRKSKGLHDEDPLSVAPPPSMVRFGASLSNVLDDEDEDATHTESAAKAKRRKIGWTNTEDLAILAAVRRIGTQWPRIANHLPGRTADAVRNRWHRLQKLHTLGDSEEGRSAIDSLLVASGVDPDWVPPELGTPEASAAPAGGPAAGGNDAGCIRGSDHGRSMWTAEEDAIIEAGVAKFGCKWRQIAALLNNRSDSSVRNRWMRLCKEKHVSREASLRSEPSPLAASLKLSPKVASPAQMFTASAPPVPALNTRQSSAYDAAKLESDLASAVGMLEVEALPLGSELPEMLVDLDSFVDAVAGVLADEGIDRSELMSFEVDERTTAPLRASPPSAPLLADVRIGWCPSRTLLAAVGVGVAALAVGAAYVRSGRSK